MQSMIHVQAKVVGKRRPLVPNWAVPIPEEMENKHRATLRELIALVVMEEVEAFEARQAERRFMRVLSKSQIENAAQRGKVDAAQAPAEVTDVVVDREQALSNALTAFEDGLYYVFLDEVQIETLDQPIFLTAGSQVTFLRLVPLAGG